MAVYLFKWVAAGCLFLGSWLLPAGADRWAAVTPPADGNVVLAPLLHPFYVSVTEINHNSKEHVLEISCKLFTNDLEAVLEKNVHEKVDLSAPRDKKAADGYIAAYVSKHLQIKVDGKPLLLRFVGSEKEQDALWSYFQADGVVSVKKMDIANSLLYDGFEQEINIMHVSVGGDRKSGKLSYPDTGISFEW